MCVCVQCIDKARDLLDAELTAMAGESYSRAYGVRTHRSGISLNFIYISFFYNFHFTCDQFTNIDDRDVIDLNTSSDVAKYGT